MPDFEQHGFQGFWMPNRRLSGEHGVLVVIKRRFNVDTVAAVCEPSDETPPVAFAAEFYDDDDPPNVSVRQPCEIAPEKKYVDLMVRGTAYAPGGKPVPKFECEVRIPHVVTRRLLVMGDRKCEWYPPLKELTPKERMKGEAIQWLDPDFSEPEPIDKLPLRYEYAYGGWARLMLDPLEEHMADEAQAIGEVKEARRERKKEIEKEIKEKGAAEKKAAADAKKPKKGPADEKARELAESAFVEAEGETRDGVTRVINADIAARIDAMEAADDGMKVVSALRLGKDLPDRPEDTATPDDGEADAEADDDAEPAEEDPNAAFFTEKKEGATAMLDLNALGDELKDLLEEEDAARARKLKDEEGVLRDRATEFGDIKLHGDNWAAEYIRKRPERKKKKREESEHPEMPFPGNPCGKGFVVSHLEEVIQDLPLPNIEDPEDPLTTEGFVVDMDDEFDLGRLRVPAGWAPYPMGWYPRARYWGVFPWDVEAAEAGKKEATKEFDPEDPDDKPVFDAMEGLEMPVMRVEAYQEAHPKLWLKEIRGDEEIYLKNLTPDGNLFFRLPGIHPTATIDMSQGPEPLSLKLDTLLLDLDDAAKPAVEMIWRGWYPLRDYDELGEKPFRAIRIIEVDQHDWLEVKRDEARDAERKGSSEGLTSAIAAITDEELAAMEDAEQKYKDSMRRRDDGLGVRMDDVVDAAVFNQTEDRRLATDDWDEAIRNEKEGFHDEARKRAEMSEEEREKEIRKLAREQADEEFGILRDEDGEVLVIDESLAEGKPPGKGGGKGGKKK